MRSYGAWLCGTVLGSVAIGLHHKLCHTLGGSFDLPHAEMHTVILPHASPTTRRQRPRRCEDRAAHWRAPSAARGFFDLNAPTAARPR